MKAKEIVDTIHIIEEMDEILQLVRDVRVKPRDLQRALDSLGKPGNLEEAFVFVAASAFIEMQKKVQEFDNG